MRHNKVAWFLALVGLLVMGTGCADMFRYSPSFEPLSTSEVESALALSLPGEEAEAGPCSIVVGRGGEEATSTGLVILRASHAVGEVASSLMTEGVVESPNREPSARIDWLDGEPDVALRLDESRSAFIYGREGTTIIVVEFKDAAALYSCPGVRIPDDRY